MPLLYWSFTLNLVILIKPLWFLLFVSCLGIPFPFPRSYRYCFFPPINLEFIFWMVWDGDPMTFMVFFSYGHFHMEITLPQFYLLNSLSFPQWFTMFHLLCTKDSYLGLFLGFLPYTIDLFIHIWAIIILLSYLLYYFILSIFLSCKNINPIMGTSPSRSHLNLVTS